MVPVNEEDTSDVITTLKIVHVALSDIHIREMLLDEMDLSDEEARRVLVKVSQSLEEVRGGPKR
jgi:hypothetical protein